MGEGRRALLVRLPAVVAGLALVRLAFELMRRVRLHYAETFQLDVGVWLAGAACSALAGALVALAVVAPVTWRAYRWRAAALVGSPLVLILAGFAAYVSGATSFDLVFRLIPDLNAMLMLAALLGTVAIAACERVRTAPADSARGTATG